MIPAFIKHYVVSNWRNIIVVILVVGVAGWLFTAGQNNQRKKDEARRKIDEQAAIKLDAKADAKSAEQLTKDAIVIAAKHERLEDAVANQPDHVPSALAVRAGCVELQLNGISTADLPACRGVTAAR